MGVQSGINKLIGTAAFGAAAVARMASSIKEADAKSASKAANTAKKEYTKDANTIAENKNIIKRLTGPSYEPGKAYVDGEAIDVLDAGTYQNMQKPDMPTSGELSETKQIGLQLPATISPENSTTSIEVDRDVEGLNKVKSRFAAINMQEPKQIGTEEEKEPEAPNIINLAKEAINPEEAINFDSDSESVIKKLAETKSNAEFENLLKEHNGPIFDKLNKLGKERSEKISEVYKNSPYGALSEEKRNVENSIYDRYYAENNVDKDFIRSFDSKYFTSSPAGYGNLMDAAAGKITEEEYLKRASYFEEPKKIAQAKKALEEIKKDPDLKEALRQKEITSYKPIEKIATEEELKNYNEIKKKVDDEYINRQNKLEEVEAPYDEQDKKLRSQIINKDAAEAYKSNKETEQKYGVSHSSLTKYFAEHPDGEKVIKIGNTSVKFTRDDSRLVISTNKGSHYTIPFIYENDKISAINNLQENKTLNDLLGGFKPYKQPKDSVSRPRVPKPDGKWYKVWSDDSGEETYEFKYNDEENN